MVHGREHDRHAAPVTGEVAYMDIPGAIRAASDAALAGKIPVFRSEPYQWLVRDVMQALDDSGYDILCVNMPRLRDPRAAKPYILNPRSAFPSPTGHRAVVLVYQIEQATPQALFETVMACEESARRGNGVFYMTTPYDRRFIDSDTYAIIDVPPDMPYDHRIDRT